MPTWPLHDLAKVFIVDMRKKPEAIGRVQSRDRKEETELGQQTRQGQGYLLEKGEGHRLERAENSWRRAE